MNGHRWSVRDADFACAHPVKIQCGQYSLLLKCLYTLFFFLPFMAQKANYNSVSLSHSATLHHAPSHYLKNSKRSAAWAVLHVNRLLIYSAQMSWSSATFSFLAQLQPKAASIKCKKASHKRTTATDQVKVEKEVLEPIRVPCSQSKSNLKWLFQLWLGQWLLRSLFKQRLTRRTSRRTLDCIGE